VGSVLSFGGRARSRYCREFDFLPPMFVRNARHDVPLDLLQACGMSSSVMSWLCVSSSYTYFLACQYHVCFGLLMCLLIVCSTKMPRKLGAGLSIVITLTTIGHLLIEQVFVLMFSCRVF